MSLRPDWTNLYLTDGDGYIKQAGSSLITGIEDEPGAGNIIPETHIIAGNYPNPFNNGTIISFSVPKKLSNSLTEVTVYDIQGKAVKKIFNKVLPTGNYLARWNGTNEFNNGVASGVYLYEVKIGAERFVRKMNLLK